MNKSTLHSEIQNGIKHLISGDITESELQIAIEKLIDEHDSKLLIDFAKWEIKYPYYQKEVELVVDAYIKENQLK